MSSAQAPPRRGTGERQTSERRTIVIRGQVAPPARPYRSTAQRHRPRRPSERIAGTRPDRAALWAVLLGVFMVVVAIMTAHGA